MSLDYKIEAIEVWPGEKTIQNLRPDDRPGGARSGDL